ASSPQPNEHLFITNSLGMKLVYVPPGEFRMGAASTEKGANPEEAPQHSVRILNGYYLGCFEVSVGEYDRVMRAAAATGPTPPSEDLRRPAYGISWDDATAFCRKLSSMPDEVSARRVYRLPSEAEWEYACRAGMGTSFAFGDQLSTEDAQFSDPARRPSEAALIGTYRPNSFGLYDMHGNVWEWCGDWFSGSYYASSSMDSPKGPANGELRVIRGGSWRAPASLCRSAFRDGNDADVRRDDYGFRVLCTLNESSSTSATDVAAAPTASSGSQELQSGALDISRLVEQIEPSVVRIDTRGRRGAGTGSGFLIDDLGTIVTNYHVVENAMRARAVFHDGKEVAISGYLAMYPEQDLAVLRLTDVPEGRKPLPICEEFPIRGQRVMALGAPYGFSFTPTDGIVSAIRDANEMAKSLPGLKLRVTWIQTTTPISPGNSGGPLINSKGEVIGVNTITHRMGQNLNFAVSAKDVKQALQKSDGLSVHALAPQATSISEIIRALQGAAPD
ncbi:MAG: SUMF1/EgtB/PvdO family nonheme iron enzyme, partial [Candidatus Hydrogenedentes bacterium]|nr:SUMF1/EgtB/PvdO family nonheme iron enzyme [Candidatus Hydrogenedentota bacterium]